MKITIRPAKKKEWSVIQKLNSQVFASDAKNDNENELDLNWPFSQQGTSYYKLVISGPKRQCYIAYLDSAPVGYIALLIKDFSYRKNKYVEIDNIGVDPKYRSQGIGRLLIQEAEKWARQQQATRLFVSAFWNNQQGIGFYKQNGFYESGVELDKKL